MLSVADAVSGYLTQEAESDGKCAGCGEPHAEGSEKCKGCSKPVGKSKGARSHVGEAVAAVLESKGDGKGKAGKRSSRTRKGKFADLPTLATGKRAVKDEAPAAKGAAEGDGPTAVAEAVGAVLEGLLGRGGGKIRTFDPDAHPRDREGQFQKVLRKSKRGDVVQVAGSDVAVQITGHPDHIGRTPEYTVVGGGGGPEKFGSDGWAAMTALDRAGKPDHRTVAVRTRVASSRRDEQEALRRAHAADFDAVFAPSDSRSAASAHKQMLEAMRGARVAEAVTAVLEDAWGGKPGTNFKQVTPEAKGKLSGILKHYKGMAHPFTQCVKDNRKRFGDRAEKVCAVVKDLNEGTTKWRKGSTQEAEMELAGFVERLLEAAGAVDDAGAELVSEALLEGLPPVERAVLESIQEAKGRGSDRAVPLKRLPDGTFAPRGTGKVLVPGTKVELPDGRTGHVTNRGTAAVGTGREASEVSMHGDSGDGTVLPGYHHSGEGEAFVGRRVTVKGSDYHGEVVKSHGGGDYSVKLDRSAKVDPALAGPNRPVRYSHDKLDLHPKSDKGGPESLQSKQARNAAQIAADIAAADASPTGLAQTLRRERESRKPILAERDKGLTSAQIVAKRQEEDRQYRAGRDAADAVHSSRHLSLEQTSGWTAAKIAAWRAETEKLANAARRKAEGGRVTEAVLEALGA